MPTYPKRRSAGVFEAMDMHTPATRTAHRSASDNLTGRRTTLTPKTLYEGSGTREAPPMMRGSANRGPGEQRAQATLIEAGASPKLASPPPASQSDMATPRGDWGQTRNPSIPLATSRAATGAGSGRSWHQQPNARRRGRPRDRSLSCGRISNRQAAPTLRRDTPQIRKPTELRALGRVCLAALKTRKRATHPHA